MLAHSRALCCEAIERGIVIAGRDVLAHALKPRVSEVRRVRLDRRIIVGIVEDDGDVASAAQLEELLVGEALVARFDGVPEPDPTQRFGKQIDERRDVVALELLEMRELPQDRPQLRAEHLKSLPEEIARCFRALSASFERLTQ